MKKNIFAILGLLVLILFTMGCAQEPNSLSGTQAIALVKEKFPELGDYPSDQLPPKSIRTEMVDTNWFIAFIQEGSGIPILSAICYKVEKDKSVVQIGRYAPAANSEKLTISPMTCN